MASIQFDTFRFLRKLTEAGVPEQQAEAQVQVMSEALGSFSDSIVTRDYLDARLDARFAEQDALINKRFSEQDRRIDKHFAEQDARVDQRFASTELRFSEFRGEMRGNMKVMQWMMAAVVATTVVPAMARLYAWIGALG